MLRNDLDIASPLHSNSFDLVSQLASILETRTIRLAINKKGWGPAPTLSCIIIYNYILAAFLIMSTNHFTASFNALPAVNLGTFLAAILIGLPV